jgi:hypothetical protein
VEIKGWRGEGEGGKTLNPHQWQTIHHLYRQGSGISALGTGFGKTVSAVGLISLMRQEGSLSRVWLQVPNNKVKDWITEIKEVMPSLKIASIDPEEAGYGSRDKRYARYWEIANSKADIIIMPESAASEIQLKRDNDAVIREKVAEDYKTEKRGASKRAVALAELKGLSDTQNGKTNRVINFEDFGCDAVVVDEAHNYKNLFSSGLSRETGMNDGRQSAKAMALYKKTGFIKDNNEGGNVFLLTATPLTNSPLEYYNMLQYIAGNELKRFGIQSIDGFIKEFADIKEGIKYNWTKNAAGWGKILTGFKNLRALQDLFFKYTDLQNDPKAAGLEKPEPFNMPNIIPSDKTQTGVLQAVSAEIERYRSMDDEEREIEYPNQNFLTFYSQMRSASPDLELFDPDEYAGWKNPKLEKLSENVRSIYDKSGAGQVVFCDRIFDSEAKFNLHDKIKASLVEKGFNEDEIIIINGFTKSGDKRSDGAVERDVSKAISGYNSGKYKVIIGTTACIGEGVNLQKNSAAVHHFDIPFRPSDFIQRNGRVDRQGNEQEKVELHTYLSTGTIDNYSAALVQNKAGWIDKLLRTKSNVFTNPDYENSIDMNGLLLSLTEEWGDKEKAEAVRGELRRQKEEAEKEARDKKMRANLKSLSLMRCSIQSVKNKNGADYKSRLDKIHNLERALKDNPLFTKRDMLDNLEPFLYNAQGNTVIRKGDVIITDNIYAVSGFNYKKQTFTAVPQGGGEERPYKISQAAPLSGDENISWRERSARPVKYHFENPAPEQKSILSGLTDYNAFYSNTDKSVVANYYKAHIACFSGYHPGRNTSPPVFTTGYDGKLVVKDLSYYDSVEDILNPFDAADRKKILSAAEAGLDIRCGDKKLFYDLIKKHMPEISEKLVSYTNDKDFGVKAMEDAAEAKRRETADYRASGFAPASESDEVSIPAAGKEEMVSMRDKIIITGVELPAGDARGQPADAAREEKPLSYKEMPPAQQLKALLDDAVEKDRVPWEKELKASASFAPFDYESGRAFSRSNLIAASLHMACIDSKDPRYLSEEKMRSAGLTADEKAVPLKAAYRVTAKDGSYKSETVSYYNAKDIAGLPELRLPKAAVEKSPPITPDPAGNSKERITGNMAGFIAALAANRSFKPAAGFRREDYQSFSAMPVNDIFAAVQGADSKAADFGRERAEETRRQRGRPEAAMYA